MSGSASNTSNLGSDENSSNPPPDLTQNPSSPYHIHPSESPSSVLVAPTLVGNNYHSWSRSFRMALVSKNKMGFLNGSIPASASTDSLFPQWEQCNTLIMSWLLNSLSPSIAQSVIYLDRAIGIWTNLRERFSQSDLLRIVELQEEVYAFKQCTQNVTDYFTGLKALWEELDNFRPMTVCGCSAKTYHTQDFIIRFLKGLDDRFSVVRSQVLLMEPLPFVNRIFSMVIQHERQQLDVVFSTNEPNSFANAAMDRSRNTTNKTNSTKKCSYCHRPGHTMDVCYSKHGYPPGHPRYPGRPNFNPRTGSSAHSAVSDASSAEEKGTNESFTQDSGLNFTRAQF
ncbi:hypothetical protein V8G54_017297 [Vigna mungo]|uniref:Retrotransposon Copia-like N-terminal domain-containing protein n=1 Tax=Vigna mungo TaxID=3915 RepID=A0AAQ3S051_VIGMU